MLSDPAAIEKICRENRTVGEKILDAIDRFISTLKSILKGEPEESVHEEARILRDMLKEYEAARELWVKALADSADTRAAQAETGDVVKGDGEAEGDLQFNEAEGPLEIDLNEEYESYGLEKINDYVYVQRKIYDTLEEDGFFNSDTNRKVVTNDASGKVIEIGKKGIYETFGKGSRYETLPAFIKKYKIATIRHIPEIIKNGTVIHSGEPNYHNPKSELTYSYIEAPIVIDGKQFYVSVDIRESYQKNMFWVHRVLINRKSQSLDVNSASSEAQSTIKKGLTKDRIPQKGSDVNSFEENSYSTTDTDLKKQQLSIIEDTNPAPNSYSTWVRSVDDIKTLEETLEDSDWSDVDEFNPDLTRKDILAAIESGKITVYSSYPIKNGVFVSPSYMEAESYSGTGKVYSKTVDIRNVAWIDPTQGQYAEVALGEDLQFNEALDDELTMREVLVGSLEGAALTEADAKVLERYRRRVREIDGYDARLREVNREIREISFGKGKRDTAKLAELKSEKARLEQDDVFFQDSS